MRAALRWLLAALSTAGAFAVTWWICAGIYELDEAVGVASAAAAIVGAPLTWWAGRDREPRPTLPPTTSPGASATTPSQTELPTSPVPLPVTPEEVKSELVIDDDGRFVGGDKVATDLVVQLLDMPAAQRSVQVRARPLEDPEYKRVKPDQFVCLREDVQSYELAINRMMRGAVYFEWQWQVSELVEAVLELRSIALPSQSDREWWFTWPADDASRPIRVGLDNANVRSVRTGSYREEKTDSGQVGVIGVPGDEPIWLTQIWSKIVWTRVVPAVIAQLSKKYPKASDDVPRLDLSNWVLSDRPPDKLARTRPSEQSVGLKPAPWTW